MKTNVTMRMGICLLVAFLTLGSSRLTAQKFPDKTLYGVWIMDSFQWEGEDKVVCGKDYTQVKIYMPDGEYACAEFVNQKGEIHVLPHEWGSYTFKNGVYTEMGREPGELNLVDKDTFSGRWTTRFDVWKRAKDFPDKLRDYILFVCKANQSPSEEIKGMLKKHLFK